MPVSGNSLKNQLTTNFMGLFLSVYFIDQYVFAGSIGLCNYILISSSVALPTALLFLLQMISAIHGLSWFFMKLISFVYFERWNFIGFFLDSLLLIHRNATLLVLIPF